MAGHATRFATEDLSWKSRTNLLLLHCQKVPFVALRSAINKYKIFCGKGNDGVKKITVCKELAQDMRALTTSVNRTGENVKCKIVHMEADFRKTHEWLTGETGAGILERDGETTW